MRYDLVDLRLFLHTVAEGSITAGARRMHLSLPSASSRIRALEHHAGVPLLVRGRRGVRPTPAGAALTRHAREVLTHAARLEGAVAGYLRPETAPLIVLAGSSAMHRLVPQALVSFLCEHPDSDVVASERRSSQTVQMLVDGEADLGVVLDDEASGSGLDTEPLGDDSLVVIGQAGGVLAGRTAMTFREVAEHPLVGLQSDAPLQRSIESNLGPHAPVARYRTLVGTLGAVISLAAAGVGLAVVPRRALDQDGALDVCDLHESWSHRRLSLCRGSAARTSSPTAGALADHIRRAAHHR
ncbi:LysR family transcriptional regulator [Pseudonocardia xinjiangensis]|uniref:LysR family transcriptional regulator n=1 Tax=Pseudonocardia xinjiangensis TaxID=75289 RepID=A0ABX1RIU1_9PSEU|nr:LysR family transcriptional regulator [Pseudonocardia xinjiangensis]NMH79148.1 LysR family transcriptional regulator [Pseudonocardia xinjiangensis]